MFVLTFFASVDILFLRMYYTYVLIDKNSEFYSGYSINLKIRIKDHKDGKVFATKTKLPVELVYYEACINKYDAIKREKYFKSGPGRKFLKHRLRYFFKGKNLIK